MQLYCLYVQLESRNSAVLSEKGAQSAQHIPVTPMCGSKHDRIERPLRVDRTRVNDLPTPMYNEPNRTIVSLRPHVYYDTNLKCQMSYDNFGESHQGIQAGA